VTTADTARTAEPDVDEIPRVGTIEDNPSASASVDEKAVAIPAVDVEAAKKGLEVEFLDGDKVISVLFTQRPLGVVFSNEELDGFGGEMPESPKTLAKRHLQVWWSEGKSEGWPSEGSAGVRPCPPTPGTKDPWGSDSPALLQVPKKRAKSWGTGVCPDSPKSPASRSRRNFEDPDSPMPNYESQTPSCGEAPSTAMPIYVSSLKPGGHADTIGVKVYWVISKLAGASVSDMAPEEAVALFDEYAKHRPGEEV